MTDGVNPPDIRDAEDVLRQILGLLRQKPLKLRQEILAEAQRRLTIECTPVADPAVSLLYDWGVLSTRTYLALKCRPWMGADAHLEQPLRLSDIAELWASDLLAIPNIGRACQYELMVVLEEYGWRFRDAYWSSSLDGTAATDAREKIKRRMAEQAASLSQARALLDEKAKHELSWPELAKRHGRSARTLPAQLHAAEKHRAFLEANPLPPSARQLILVGDEKRKRKTIGERLT